MTFIAFIIVIGVLVFVHELGHFIMAKRAGVRVEKFSLGMGPKLFGYKKGDTEYLISALPLGGYVKMAGENPDEEPTGASDEFQSKTVWQRAKIAATGPLTNILLAFIVMPVVFMIGIETAGPAIIRHVEKGSPAESAGFMPGDVVESINGKTIKGWERAQFLIALNPNTNISVAIDRGGEKKILSLRPIPEDTFHSGVSGMYPDVPPLVTGVSRDMPADKAGIKVGDKIVSVDNKPIYYYEQFSALINNSKGRTVEIGVERNGKRLFVHATPVLSDGKYRVGVEIKGIIKTDFKKFGFIESIGLGFSKTVELMEMTFITLKKLVTLKLSIKSLGGPVMIAQLSGAAAKSGLSNFLSFMAFISVSLGILNLLPIPVLDGGLLVFLAIEAVRKKPLARRTMEIAQSIGAALLITLIAVVSYNDVMRMFFSK